MELPICPVYMKYDILLAVLQPSCIELHETNVIPIQQLALQDRWRNVLNVLLYVHSTDSRDAGRSKLLS